MPLVSEFTTEPTKDNIIPFHKINSMRNMLLNLPSGSNPLHENFIQIDLHDDIDYARTCIPQNCVERAENMGIPVVLLLNQRYRNLTVKSTKMWVDLEFNSVYTRIFLRYDDISTMSLNNKETQSLVCFWSDIVEEFLVS